MQAVLILSCWILGALQAATLILIPEMMLRGQLSALQLAIPLSIGTFVFMYCSGQWGKILDKRLVANKPLTIIIRWVLVGFIASQLTFVSLLQFTSFYGVALVIALCSSRLLHGIFCSAIIPITQITLSRSDSKGEKLVWSSIAINVGRITVPLLTFVPVQIHYFSLWFIATITFFALCVACLNKEKNVSVSKQLDSVKPNKAKPNKDKPELFTLFNNPLLLSICISAVLISLFSSQLQFSLGPLFLVKFANAALASEVTATLLFASSASALTALFILYRPLSRYPKVFLLVIAVSLIIGSTLFIMQQHLIIAVVLLSAALSMGPVWYTAIAIHASEHNKARASASVSQGHTLGNACGGLVGGGLLVFGQSFLLLSFGLFTTLILIAWGIVFYSSYNNSQANNSRLLKINNT